MWSRFIFECRGKWNVLFRFLRELKARFKLFTAWITWYCTLYKKLFNEYFCTKYIENYLNKFFLKLKLFYSMNTASYLRETFTNLYIFLLLVYPYKISAYTINQGIQREIPRPRLRLHNLVTIILIIILQI